MTNPFQVALIIRNVPIELQIADFFRQGLAASGATPVITEYLIEGETGNEEQIRVAVEDFEAKSAGSPNRAILGGYTSDDLVYINSLVAGTNIIVTSVSATSPQLATLTNGITFAYNDTNLVEEWLMLLSGYFPRYIAVVFDEQLLYGQTLNELVQASAAMDTWQDTLFNSFSFQTNDRASICNAVDGLQAWVGEEGGLEEGSLAVLWVSFDEDAIFGINLTSPNDCVTWYLTDSNLNMGDEFGWRNVVVLGAMPINFTTTYFQLYQQYRGDQQIVPFSAFLPAAYDVGFLLGRMVQLNIPLTKDNVTAVGPGVFTDEPPAYLETNRFDPDLHLLEFSCHAVVFTKQVLEVIPEVFYPSFQGDLVVLPESFSEFARLFKVSFVGQGLLALELYVFNTYFDEEGPVLQKMNDAAAIVQQGSNPLFLGVGQHYRSPVTQFVGGSYQPSIFPRYEKIELLVQCGREKKQREAYYPSVKKGIPMKEWRWLTQP